ncbi:MAG TPA: nitroreductase family deazaflavin-dependent oxidoreductase [Thermomicrobiales bacterium]|nr:nitroreductase family deazaflavin-dependent oxidoreductase [Thermomicrobiales bacterium]
MPAPRWLARANRIGLNRVMLRLAPRMPGFGVVVHRGRRSGREYETPVNVFRHGDCISIALTYGRESEWVRNVLADSGCRLVTRRHELALTEPRLVRDESRRAVPTPVRVPLRLLGVADFLELTVAG